MATHALGMGPRRKTPPAGAMDVTVLSLSTVPLGTKLQSASTPSWTDDLPVCPLSGIGYSTNQVYRADGGREEEHENEDRFFHFKIDDNFYLYGVFDGHSGKHVADFVRQRLPVELCLGQLNGVDDDHQVKKILQIAFLTVERAFFETIDKPLAEKTNLKLQLPEGLSDYKLYQQYPDVVGKLVELDEDIVGGTSAILSLINRRKLYVANVGDSRAVLCTREPDGSLKVCQLSIDHTIDNEDEKLRLSHLNLDVAGIQHAGQHGMGLGGHSTTRSIGDYSVKGGYKDIEVLKYAASEPVIADPEIIGGIPIDAMCGFLLIFTNGLIKSISEATHTTQVNMDIAYRVAAEFAVQSTLSGVAQQVVDKVVRQHHDVYLEGGDRAPYNCQKRDDITLLVRNFNYPMGSAVSPLPYSSVTMPYNSPPTPHRTQTSLSLFIPRSEHPPPALSHSISQTPVITAVTSGTPFTISSPPQQPPSVPYSIPLTINVADPPPPPIPTSPSSSHSSTIGSSSGTSTPQKYDTTHTNSTGGTQGSSNSDSQENRFLFGRLAPETNTHAGPDEEGFIEPYVDFSEFYEAYEAAFNEAQEGL